MADNKNTKYEIQWKNVIGLVLIIIVVIVIAVQCGKKKPSGEEENSSVTTTAVTTAAASEDGPTTLKYAPSQIGNGSLILVNALHPFSGDHTAKDFELVSVINAKNAAAHYIVIDNEQKMVRPAIIAMNYLADAFYENTGLQLRILSSYNGGVQGDDAATGLVCKLGLKLAGDKEEYAPYSYNSAENPSANFLTDYAPQYGFITRYPVGKDDVTGVASNDALLRYVGIPSAVYMQQNNMAFEEYMPFIKTRLQDSPLTLTSRGVEYTVYFVKKAAKDDTVIVIPAGYNYEVSGDNTDGFIVTQWRKDSVPNGIPDGFTATQPTTEEVTTEITTISQVDFGV